MTTTRSGCAVSYDKVSHLSRRSKKRRPVGWGGSGGSYEPPPPLPGKVRLVATNNLTGLKHVSHVYRGYYTVARRYEFYV